MHLRSSLIIDNYNYAAFLREACASAFAQTRPFDEVILVDDGSTDDSDKVLDMLQQEYPNLRIVKKRNGGQLSAFVTGIQASTGDLVFFLDSDDQLHHTHHERLRSCMETHREVGMAFSAHESFGAEQATHQDTARVGNWGMSVIPTLYEAHFIGSITSTLAFRRSVLDVLLPVMDRLSPLWRTRADDCLILGASLAGATKFYTGEVTVRYRIHDTNAYARVHISPLEEYRHFLRRRGYVRCVASHLGLNEEVLQRATIEFSSAAVQTPERKQWYLRIVRKSSLPWLDKIKTLIKLAKA